MSAMSHNPKNYKRDQALLEVQGLKTVFHTPDKPARAVDSLDMIIYPRDVVGLVGESGSGKTVTALSILGLIEPPGEINAEKLHFDGIDLLKLDEDHWEGLRGARIAMVFQDPQVRLNPVFSIGSQLAETIQVHQGLRRQEAWDRAVELLEMVDFPDAAQRAMAYPHELSVGQAQRVMIAMALAIGPELMIADEPTSALDVTIQAQILELIRTYQAEAGTAVLLISHDLAVVAQLANRVMVLYAGHILEEAPTVSIFDRPYHPYTQGLIASIPYHQELGKPLKMIPGRIPDSRELPSACRFAPRCEARKKYQLEICEQEEPMLKTVTTDHKVRCWLYHSSVDHRAPLDGSKLANEIA
jgi:oligopeptide/dipeptide ABC transporter ATP-binding protein